MLKKKLLIPILLSLFFIGLFSSYAQKGSFIDKVDKKYENHKYSEAIKDYEKLAKKGRRTPQISKRLADSYYFNARYPEASKWYKNFFETEKNDSITSEYFFRYSLSLKSLEQYEQANLYLLKYYQIIGKEQTKINTYLYDIETNSWRYEIENVENLNSKYSDYGTNVFQGNIIFASSRKHKKNGKAITSWNNQHFTSIYAYSEGEQPTLFLENVNSRINESTPAFTKDGKTVYFTRNNFLKKRGYSKNKSTLLKIYRAQLVNGKWRNVRELPFCSNDYSVAHPALSPDEKTLYFASDMPGGLGSSDIWKVEIKKNGTFGKPINLGPTVNTSERESFPFVSADNELYYASNGKLGLGGLDIFVSEITEDENYKEAVNIGKPINSSMDDFGFFINTADNSGFFTSNRPGGKGDDDIYSFRKIKDLDQDKIEEEIEIILEPNIDKVIVVDVDININLPNSNSENFSQNNNPFEPKIGMDLGEFLNVIIHFDLDKWNIRKDATIELEKIFQTMQDYPKIKVDVRSHTDSRQTHKYNEKLSDRRAKSTRNWLIQKGISPDRLTAKGYGETQLVNHCADEVTCSEEEHQANRRSEFIITDIVEN